MLVRALNSSAIKDLMSRFRFHQAVQEAVNGGITFGVPSTQLINGTNQTVPQHCENIDGVLVVVNDTGLANTEFAVIHNLNRIPQLLDVKRINANSIIFDSGTPWTTTKIFLKCPGAHLKVTLHIH